MENTTSGKGGGILVGVDLAGNPGNPVIVNNTIINNKDTEMTAINRVITIDDITNLVISIEV